MPTTASKMEIGKLKHPEYMSFVREWMKFWAAYQGGQQFVSAYLKRYSKRESKRDFENRISVTYNPPDSQSAMNDVRDALLTHMHEVTRSGDPRYVAMMESDVDTFRSSMTTFVGTAILPRLLSQGKVFVFVDAPPASAAPQVTPAESGGKPLTRAEEEKQLPYLWAFHAEQCLSWTYDDRGRMTSALIELLSDVVDPYTGLTVGAQKEYRLLKLLQPGEMVGNVTGPGVVVVITSADGTVKSINLLDLDRVPIVEFRIAQALMTDIADMQVALMNLTSTDMAFLFRGNFPLYTEQYDPATAIIAPTARKKRELTDTQSRDIELDDTDGRGSSIGGNTGRRYTKGLQRPGYVSPPTENLRASMEKQGKIGQSIRAALDLAMTALSVAAVEQSGESKKQDRVGLSAGLRYIATQLENGEREINDIIHLYLGERTIEGTVEYPSEFSEPDAAERDAELKRLQESRAAVRSETYQREMSKRIAESQLTGITDEETLEEIRTEIDEALWFDESTSRAGIVNNDVREQLISRETGAILRGYDADETAKRLAEQEVAADSRAFGREAIPGEGIPADGAPADGIPADGAPIASLAMNGAQVTSLQAIIENVTAQRLAPEAAVLMILAAFPTLSQESVRKMVASASSFKLAPVVESVPGVK